MNLARPRPRHPANESCTAYLPESFDAAVIKPAWADYARWVLSEVVLWRYLDRGIDASTFVPLDRRCLEAHLPKTVWRPLLNDLIRKGVLECDTGFNLKSYYGEEGTYHNFRLGKGHRTARIRPHRVAHPALLKKVAEYALNERAAITNPVHLALRAWHDAVGVTPSAPVGKHPVLDRLLSGERRFTVCNQGKVDTSVANLPRKYRRFIRVEGRELVSCEVSALRPLILGILVGNQTRDEGWNPAAMIYRCPELSLNTYLDDCLDGTVYDRAACRAGCTPEAVNRVLLSVIHGSPGRMSTAAGKALQRLYPSVFRAISTLKLMYGCRAQPRLMRRMEGGVMIDRVAARLVREHPSLPLLTLHDGMAVPPEHTDAVKRVFEEEWEEEFGLVPDVAVTPFSAPQSYYSQPSRPRPITQSVQRQTPLRLSLNN